MTSFIKKSDDKILTEVWKALIEFYDCIDEQEIAKKVPHGYSINIDDEIKTPDFIKTLKKYFNADASQSLRFFEIKNPGWGKHLDSSLTGDVYTGSCIWPIKNCSSENITKWYEHTKGKVECIELNHSQKNSGGLPWKYSDDSVFTLIDSTIIDGPTIIRTDIPHEVNSPDKTRVIASWKLGNTKNISWDEICDLYR